ncbi:hypothetical protein [Acetonema longum]|uniref:Glycerophosphoryl diester phosphodiesterase membrane domain-containing protein n=1 Tax=Acetonema longum DSM 6540 TaxID=1009370 RepID=F7NE61_9FIRM|nr:hypothetical protein [Acetonema longum]EGO65716.1 hypothetical protein ALO_01619 [Acetonema longum DSM 6540]
MVSLTEKELSLSVIIRYSVRIFIKEFKFLIAASLAFTVLVLVSMFLLMFLTTQLVQAAPVLAILVFIMMMVLFTLIPTYQMILVTLKLNSRIQDVKVSLGQLLKESYAKLFPVYGGVLLMVVYLLLWGLLLIIPGIYKTYKYILAPSSMILKSLSAREAIHYSQTLTAGRWWKTLLSFLLPFLPMMALSVLCQLVALWGGNPWQNMALFTGLIVSWLTGVLQYSIIAVITFVLFINYDSQGKAVRTAEAIEAPENSAV